MDCAELHEVADELALDMLTGAERAAALLHLERCDSCRGVIASLTVTADVVLLATPTIPPPAGFESRVLARVDETNEDETNEPVPLVSRRRRRWLRPLLVAAAFLAVVLVTVALLPNGGGDAVAATEMRAADGSRVGSAYVNDADPTGLVVKVTDWETASSGQLAAAYRLDVGRDDGTREVVPLDFAADYSWHVTLDADARDVVSVALIGADGTVLCSGSFGDGAR
jgi:hypothetical protein